MHTCRRRLCGQKSPFFKIDARICWEYPMKCTQGISKSTRGPKQSDIRAEMHRQYNIKRFYNLARYFESMPRHLYDGTIRISGCKSAFWKCNLSLMRMSKRMPLASGKVAYKILPNSGANLFTYNLWLNYKISIFFRLKKG